MGALRVPCHAHGTHQLTGHLPARHDKHLSRPDQRRLRHRVYRRHSHHVDGHSKSSRTRQESHLTATSARPESQTKQVRHRSTASQVPWQGHRPRNNCTRRRQSRSSIPVSNSTLAQTAPGLPRTRQLLPALHRELRSNCHSTIRCVQGPRRKQHETQERQDLH